MTPAQLRALMERHNLTNLALAELLGIHRNTVSRWLLHVPGTKKGTPIDAANAMLIRETLKKLKK
jgi:transcriptional regulator with XRE-family HTH domain